MQTETNPEAFYRNCQDCDDCARSFIGFCVPHAAEEDALLGRKVVNPNFRHQDPSFSVDPSRKVTK